MPYCVDINLHKRVNTFALHIYAYFKKVFIRDTLVCRGNAWTTLICLLYKT